MTMQTSMNEYMLTFSKTAFLLWETQCKNYEFADYLNQLYHIALARQDDLTLSDNTTCPFFFYHDSLSALLYILIENPRSGIFADFTNYDKIMLINGRDAFDRQNDIYNDYATHPFPPPDDDLLQYQHYQLIQQARQSVFSTHYFDYRESAEMQQYHNDTLNIVLQSSKKARAPRKQIGTPIPKSSILAAIRNENSPKVRKRLNNLFLLFKDILQSLEAPIYERASKNIDSLDLAEINIKL